MFFRKSSIDIISGNQAFEKHLKGELKASPWVWIPSVADEEQRDVIR